LQEKGGNPKGAFPIMTTSEAKYWSSEYTDEEIDAVADAGQRLLDAIELRFRNLFRLLRTNEAEWQAGYQYWFDN